MMSYAQKGILSVDPGVGDNTHDPRVDYNTCEDEDHDDVNNSGEDEDNDNVDNSDAEYSDDDSIQQYVVRPMKFAN